MAKAHSTVAFIDGRYRIRVDRSDGVVVGEASLQGRIDVRRPRNAAGQERFAAAGGAAVNVVAGGAGDRGEIERGRVARPLAEDQVWRRQERRDGNGSKRIEADDVVGINLVGVGDAAG